MSKHNYTNPAFCQSSEFYPVPSSAPIANYDTQTQQHNSDEIYNRSNLNVVDAVQRTKRQQLRDEPLRIHRSMSTRSYVSQKSTAQPPANTAERKPTVTQRQLQRQHHDYQIYQKQYNAPAACLNRTTDGVFDAPEAVVSSGRYALVPVEEFGTARAASSRYAIVPGAAALSDVRRGYAKSQENIECPPEARTTHQQRRNAGTKSNAGEEPHSFHETLNAEQFTSLPPTFDERSRRQCTSPSMPKIKHAFSSDFGSKSFLLVDKNSNQRYQMVPTAENEELVDDNQEIIQMHNGRAHRYAVIPTEEEVEDPYEEDEYGHEDDMANEADGLMEEETCLSNGDFTPTSLNCMALNFEAHRTPLRTSTPQKGASTINLITTPQQPPSTPLKNPAATKMLHELLSTPRKTPLGRIIGTTPRFVPCNREQLQQLQRERRLQVHQHYLSQQHIYYTPNSGGGGGGVGIDRGDSERHRELVPHRLQYEKAKTAVKPSSATVDRTMAVISPRVAGGAKQLCQQLDETNIEDPKSNNNSYSQKVANATITLAIISLMLVLGGSMNCALSIYMIAHLGKSFYLVFSLIASLCGVGLGFLGFRSRHCDWLPNRSYTSGYILVTAFSLLKCCGLLVILVLDPYPGLPLHDVTTGVILGLSSFMMFFIGLGVIGSMWCYRPPPDNRVNVV